MRSKRRRLWKHISCPVSPSTSAVSHLRGEIKGWGEGGKAGVGGERRENHGASCSPAPTPPHTLRHPGGPASSPLCPEALPPGWLHEAGGGGEGMDDGGKGREE